MKIAFSTVACPDWTLERVMSFADDAEYQGVELRTFGWSCTDFACDPALTDSTKVRRLAIESGTHVMCLGTSLRFDAPVWPPVMGRAMPGHDRNLEDAKRFIALANDMECPHLRVFGFDSPKGEKRSRTVARVVERLQELLAVASKHRVTLALENGGAFSHAAQVAEVLDECDSPWLGAAYNITVGARDGDHVEEAIDLLGERLVTVKLKDMQGTQPVEIGHGEMPLERGVKHLARLDYPGWLVVEWMKHWRPELAEPEGVLRRALETVETWVLEAGCGSGACCNSGASTDAAAPAAAGA
ncbi:MAG: sugar phosphate isomerase/epimerase family protein [Planctomycetota bacterium]|nr:sugar phosphate isomerase/epimerase family protein [Planctomycetota bacterium]